MRIVLLVGSSTAGKSSLCNELVSTYQWETLSTDDMFEKMLSERPHQTIDDIHREIIAKLKDRGITESLQKYMTEDDIFTLAMSGTLNLTKGERVIANQKFTHPTLPNLEEVLSKAKYNDDEIRDIARNLRYVTDIGLKAQHVPSLTDLLDRVLKESFKKGEQASIILDVVPEVEGDIEYIFEYFNKKIREYHENNADVSLTTATVFAYCPPQKLSERILKRNIEAHENQKPENQRIGLFPFYQLTNYVRVVDLINGDVNSLTKDEVFDIVLKHENTSQSQDRRLILENPVDHMIMKENRPETVEQKTNKDGKIQLDSDDTQLPIIAKPRIGNKKNILEFENLTNKLGFFAKQEQASIVIRRELPFDIILHTSFDKPNNLAKKLLDELEKKANHAHPPSKP